MAAKSILDTDMATLAGWLRTGFDWWLGELRGMVPAALRRRETALAGFIHYRGPGAIETCGKGSGLPVLVDPALCLIRRQTLPPLGDADLQRLVQLDADRIFPLGAARLVIAARADPADRTAVTVAALPRETASAMLAELRALGEEPSRIALASSAEPGRMALDFTPGFAEAGLLPPVRKAAAGWWALVAFLFVFNIGLLVWRDAQQVARMEALVAAQQPAIGTARKISGRIGATRRMALQLAERRRTQDGLAVLAAVTQALPAQAWVQRYGWDGRTIRISGYKRQGVDVIGALRQSPRFEDVRAASSEAIAEVTSGQPFDLTAEVRGSLP